MVYREGYQGITFKPQKNKFFHIKKPEHNSLKKACGNCVNFSYLNPYLECRLGHKKFEIIDIVFHQTCDEWKQRPSKFGQFEKIEERSSSQQDGDF